MSYRNLKRPKWLTKGSGCGCATLLIVVIAGWPVLFARAWNCNHRVAGSTPCDTQADSWIVLSVLIAAVVLAGLTKWAFDRRDGALHDEEQ